MSLGTVPVERSIRRRQSTKFRFDIGVKEYSNFIEGIRLGLSIEDSAWNAGLTPQRVFDWLKKGELYAEVLEDLVPSSPAWQYARFWEDYMRARSNMVARHVANIDHCSRTPATSSGQWMASKYMLAVKHPEQWSEKYQLQKIKEDGQMELIKFFFENATDATREELASLVQLIPSLKLTDAS